MVADVARLEGLEAILEDFKLPARETPKALVVSIDVGSTYSGVAYVFSTNPETTHFVSEWPSSGSKAMNRSPKVPTVMRYKSSHQFDWGYQVGPLDDKKIEIFKLLLDPSLPKPLYTSVGKIQKNIKEFQKEPKDVLEDFISALYQHAITKIEENHEDYLEVMDLKFVVSMPAGWPEAAKQALLQAARKAGIDPITQISEPEAAAIFTMRSEAVKNADLKVGDTIMVCDAGGATADLMSYNIKKLNPLELVGIVEPMVGLAGSLSLNFGFQNHIKKSLYDEEEYIALRKDPRFVVAVEQFDQDIKLNFTSSSTKKHNIRLNGPKLTDDPAGKLKNNVITFDTPDLERIFQPVADTIATSITSQIDKVRVYRVNLSRQDKSSVKAIFLVGGFGSSKYLKERLQKKFPLVKLVQPVNGWTAVLRVSKRKTSAKHYGVSYSPQYDESLHAAETKYWDPWEGVWRCTSVKWMIKKGERLDQTKRISLQSYKQCPPHPSSSDLLSIKASINECSSNQLPSSSTDFSVSENVTLNVRLDSLPSHVFRPKTRTSDNTVYWEVFYQIILEIDNGDINAWIDVNGAEYQRTLLGTRGVRFQGGYS